MTDRPILFSGLMVRALLEARKTQTRRVLTAWCDEPPAFIADGVVTAFDEDERPYRWPRTASVGDRLWVRELWRTGLAYEDLPPSEMGGEEPVLFEADGRTERWTRGSSEPGRLRQGIHMPRWASRLTLIVTDVRVQRLQEISANDAEAEGISISGPDVAIYRREAARNHEAARRWNAYRVREFRDLWNSLNAERGYGWDANPWVVAVSFDVNPCNIDELSPATVGHGGLVL